MLTICKILCVREACCVHRRIPSTYTINYFKIRDPILIVYNYILEIFQMEDVNQRLHPLVIPHFNPIQNAPFVAQI